MIKDIFNQIWYSCATVLDLLFGDDLNVMSREVREILSNPEDAKLYKEACDAPKPVTITFSNGRTLTLV